MINIVLKLFGYLGVLYVGISSFYITSKLIEYFRKRTDEATHGFSLFFNRHWYGFGLLLWFFIMFCSVCMHFYLND